MQLFFSRYFLGRERQSSYMNSTLYMKHSPSHVLKFTMDGTFFKITMTSANPSTLPELVYLILPLECTTIFITSMESPGTVVQIKSLIFSIWQFNHESSCSLGSPVDRKTKNKNPVVWIRWGLWLQFSSVQFSHSVAKISWFTLLVCVFWIVGLYWECRMESVWQM